MSKETQLTMTLFDLNPRNEGKKPIDLRQGGLAELTIHNFKGIDELAVQFDPMTLLVGANNSGKSTLLQAIRLFYYCIDKCGVLNENGRMTLKKQVMPFSDFTLIPAHDVKELVTNGITPSSKRHGIYFLGKLRSGQTFDFTIYTAYTTLFVILPGEKCPKRMTKEEFDFASRQPLYVPGFSGIVTKELLSTNRRLEESLGSGHHNEVLRNLILRLKTKEFDSLAKALVEEFGVKFQGIPGNPNDVEFLRAAYRDGGLRIPLDIVSAGSGFLQVLQILTHALQSPSPILLLDEPDAHMHTLLQQHFINLLREFANERKMQIVMASHSETFTRTMNLSEIRLIDRKTNRADKFTDPAIMKADLNAQGVWPAEPQLTEALRIKRILLCEASADEELLCAFANKKVPNWSDTKKQYQVIPTEGSNDAVVARMQTVVSILDKLLSGGVKTAYLRDRDLMSDERKEQAEKQAAESNLDLVITERRNRESYLLNPTLVEKAVLSLGDKVPSEWSKPGVISSLVLEWCIDYCKEQIDDLPGHIREYNLRWMRTQYPEPTSYRVADARLDAYIRTNWYSKIDKKEIPWKLMDGRGALTFIRRNLQEKGIVLHEPLLLNHLTSKDIPVDFTKLIEIIQRWG